MLLSIAATEWTYETDLTQGPGQLTVTYTDTSAFRPSEALLSGMTRNDIVRLHILTAGTAVPLGDFIVDEHRVRETPDGLVHQLAARDAKAALLERFPTTHVTYPGLRIRSGSLTTDCEILPSATLVDTLRTMIRAAGFRDNINIDDFPLGTDYVHGTDRSYGEAIFDLLGPLRQTERYRADLYLISDTVWVWQRDRGAPFGTVVVPYDMLIERSIEKQRPTLPSSVQVLGPEYICMKPRPAEPPNIDVQWPDDKPPPGEPAAGPYELHFSDTERDPVFGNDLYTFNATYRYNATGQIESIYAVINWTSQVLSAPGAPAFIASLERVETIIHEFTYGGTTVLVTETGTTFVGTISASHLIRERVTKLVQDNSDIYTWDGNTWVATDKRCVNQVVLRAERTISYYADVFTQLGQLVPRTQATTSYQADERFGTVNQGCPTLDLVLGDHSVQFYVRSANQLFRTGMVTLTNAGGFTVSEAPLPEIAAELSTTSEPQDPETFTIPLPGRRGDMLASSAVMTCGPDTAQSILTLPLVGDRTALCRLRDQISRERSSFKVLARLTLPATANVREGMELLISGAPPRWETTRFFVTGRAYERTPDAFIMRVVGVTWLT